MPPALPGKAPVTEFGGPPGGRSESNPTSFGAVGFQEGPQMAQEGPTRVPNKPRENPKEAPRELQERPKGVPREPKKAPSRLFFDSLLGMRDARRIYSSLVLLFLGAAAPVWA